MTSDDLVTGLRSGIRRLGYLESLGDVDTKRIGPWGLSITGGIPPSSLPGSTSERYRNPARRQSTASRRLSGEPARKHSRISKSYSTRSMRRGEGPAAQNAEDCRSRTQSFDPISPTCANQSHLTFVIRRMAKPADQDSQTISKRLLCKILLRYRTVPLQPFVRLQRLECLDEFFVYD
jgi:hypothetical protein